MTHRPIVAQNTKHRSNWFVRPMFATCEAWSSVWGHQLAATGFTDSVRRECRRVANSGSVALGHEPATPESAGTRMCPG
jgi:hypothetical protein